MSSIKFAKYFKTEFRPLSGEMYTVLLDTAPEWLRDAVYAAHGDKLPCDWVFDECRAACDAFDSGELTEDSLHEHADSQVDTYNMQLFSWAHENSCML